MVIIQIGIKRKSPWVNFCCELFIGSKKILKYCFTLNKIVVHDKIKSWKTLSPLQNDKHLYYDHSTDIAAIPTLSVSLSLSLSHTSAHTNVSARANTHSVTTHTCDGGNHRASSHSLTAELVSHRTLQIDETAAGSTPAFIELINNPDWCEYHVISCKGLPSVLLLFKHIVAWLMFKSVSMTWIHSCVAPQTSWPLTSEPLQRPWCWATRGSVTFWMCSWVCTDSSSPAC